jgi:hypothetical protein
VPRRSRTHRGAVSVEIAAEFLRGQGFPGAHPVAPGRQGTDILGCVGLHFEVKARRDWNAQLLTHLQQANKGAGENLPMLLSRPDGYGPEKIADWPVTMRFEDWVTLARDAGYGSKRDVED